MFPILSRLRMRQWLPLSALLLATSGAAVGAAFGQHNSWVWFIGGGLVAIVIGVITQAGRSRREHSVKPRE